MLKQLRKGQTIIEYVILMILVIGAFIAIGNYFKRGMSGRWKEATDQLGEQYDPTLSNGVIRHTLVSNTETRVMALDSAAGTVTLRQDSTNSIDTRTGGYTVGAY